jgi:NAD(P)H-hydrate epimerase
MTDFGRELLFRTEEGVSVPAVTAEEMREVDRIAVEEFGLGILQMMENAGRNLAENVLAMLDSTRGEVTVLAGSGGNGGGGLCSARHLHNRGFKVWVVLDTEAATLTGAARNQLQILQAAGLELTDASRAVDVLSGSQVVVDALIGYGLQGAPRGKTAELIDLCNQHASRVLSLDVPSGLQATTGEGPGAVVRPERTLTLALPKTGLHGVPGDLYLADIGIPPEVFDRIGLSFEPPFRGPYWVRLLPVRQEERLARSGLAD